MKKALIVLLTLALAGGLFAQDVSFTGHVGTGTFFNFGGKDAAGEKIKDVSVKADDDDANVPVRGQFNVEAKDDYWGLKLGLRANIGAAPYMLMNNAYGWLLPFDILKISAGLIDDGVWGTRGDYDGGVATGGGMRFEIMPIDGLNLGAFFTYPHNSGDATVTPVVPANPGTFAGKVGNWLGETAFGFEYVADIFYVSAAMKMYSEETDGSADGYEGKTKKSDMKLIFGGGFTGIAGLTLTVSGGVEHLASYSDNGSFDVREVGEFALSDTLKVGILLAEGLTGPESFCFFKVKPYVELGVTDAISVGGDLGITLEKANHFFGVKGGKDSLGFATFFGDIWGKYTLGGGWMKAGYGLTNKMKDYGDSLDHYIKLIFGFDF